MSNIFGFDVTSLQPDGGNGGIGTNTGTTTGTTQEVGDFVTDVRFRPFIRAQQVHFWAFGMRPNTRVYAFFDKQDVNDRVHPATVINEANPIAPANLRVDWETTVLTVDANGRLFGVFDLPANTFIVGERELLFCDVDDLDSLVSATTVCSSLFNAYNFSVTTAPIPAPQPPVVQNPPIINVPNVWPMDPLAQTFYVDPELCADRVGCFVTKVDLYFKTKHPTLGVTVELRTTENGYPTKTILPFSQVHLNPSQVSTSDVGANATTFVFPSPVYLRAGQEYALAVIPDANNPDYTLFVAEIGGDDVLDDTVSVTQDWGIGMLFMSHNNSTWSAIQNEDLKFTLYRANFSVGGGSLILVNGDYEFLTLEDVNDSFEPGEFVFQNANTANGTVSVSAGNNNVTGTGTSFLTDFAAGRRIVLKSGTAYDVQEVLAVTNATHLTTKDSLAFSNTAATYMKTPTGVVYSYDGDVELVLEQSGAANSSFVFTANSTIIGETSGANAVIASVDDRIVNRFQPSIYRTVAQGTDITLEGQASSNTYDLGTQRSMRFNATNFFDIEETIIASRSNEITEMDGDKSFRLELNLDTETSMLSPSIDAGTFFIVSYENIVNNDSNNEYLSNGSALSRWTSKVVQLADGQESEDVRVYLTAYRPSGTDIEVYVKLKNDADAESFNTKYWTKLERQADVLSDGSNRNNTVEIEYRLPARPETVLLDGVVSVANASANVAGNGTTFSDDLAAGDSVLIGNGSDYFITSVDEVTSNTAVVLNTNAPFSADGATIERLVEPHTAFRNPQNDNVVSYINVDGAQFDEFKFFAVKIVLKSESTHVVPHVRDMRALALSV